MKILTARDKSFPPKNEKNFSYTEISLEKPNFKTSKDSP